MFTMSRCSINAFGLQGLRDKQSHGKHALWSEESGLQMFLELMSAMCSRPRMKRPFLIVISNKFCDSKSSPDKGHLHFFDGSINAEKYFVLLDQNVKDFLS